MISLNKVRLPALACMAALALGGCSNTGEGLNLGKTLKSLFTRGNAAEAPPPKVNINAVLKATAPQSLLMVNLKDQNNITSLMLEIQKNGAYRTYSTAARQTFTFRNGLVTSTRGLGDDLMSSINGESLSRIRARRSGSGKRVMTYLNGAGDTLRLEFSCETYITGSGRVKQGAVSAAATELTENCDGGKHKFTNVYQVDGSGMILNSQQWLGPRTGYADVKVLRR